jgi:hypothetical protein
MSDIKKGRIFNCTHGNWEQERFELEHQLALARKGLQSILDYGQALQPTPMHHVTFYACVIAQQTLAALDGKAGEGR